MALNSGLQFTLTVEGLPETAFVVTQFKGQESLSRLFQFDVSLASRDERITPEQVLDKNISLKVWQNGLITQSWQGIAQTFERGDTGLHHSFYRLEMVPAFKRSSLRHNSRIFQLLSAPEIMASLLEEMGITDYAFSTARVCEQREYCVQYRETDLDFISRLAAEEGLTYYFSHLEEKHILVFCDDTQNAPSLALPAVYNTLGGSLADHPYVRTFKRYTEADVSSVQLKDYSFKRPEYSFLHETIATDLDSQQVTYEHYDYPGRYKSDDSGKAFSQYRLDAIRKEAITAKGESSLASLMSGHKVSLLEHPQEECNQDWLIVSVEHTGTQPQALEEMGGEGATTYNNQFDVIPATRQWRPDVNSKPCVDGPQIATVVGPAGEEIYCDEFGRVKVQFSWDRLGLADEFSSCWMRVSQGWAGGQYGMQALPRVGHEVIVSFLEGDPDQPIVTGRTYNANNQPPYALPEHKSKTVIRTQSHQGEGFNELSFEDQAEQEEIYLHAQKDLNLKVQNDRKETIANDLTQTVGHDRFEQVGFNDNLTVEGNQTETITGDHSQQTDDSLHIKITDKHTIQTGTDVTLKAGTKVVIEAGAEMLLSAGGSTVKIDAAGVSMSGAAINLNSGGGAGSGAAYAGQLAELPKFLELAEIIDPSMIALEKGMAVAGEANVQDVAFEAVEVEFPVLAHKVIADLANEVPITELCSSHSGGVCPVCGGTS